MKILTNLIILFVTLSIVAPMIYLFLTTFLNATFVFWFAIICAVCLAITGFNEDTKKIQK